MIPIIYLSLYNNSELHLEAMSHGGDAFLLKSISAVSSVKVKAVESVRIPDGWKYWAVG